MFIKKEYPGVITIYCSLIFLLLFGLIAASLESAHVEGVRVSAQYALDAGLDSLFAGYDADLYEEYGLLFLNETQYADSGKKSTLKKYIESGVSGSLLSFSLSDVSILNEYYATDDEGVFFKREVLELMKVYETASLFGELNNFITAIANGKSAKEYLEQCREQYEETDWSEEAKKNAGEGDEEDDDDEEDEEEDDIDEKIDSSIAGSIITQASELFATIELALFVDDINDLSSASKSGSLTFTTNHGISMDTGIIAGGVDELLFDEYVINFSNNYVNPKKSSGIKYEAEYILSGRDSDVENLAETVNSIMGIRLGLNIAYLLVNKDAMSQARATAASMVSAFGMPALTEIVTILLIGAWAQCESILDIRSLLAGETIPFFKTKDSWTTGLLTCVSEVLSKSHAKEVKIGTKYRDYLRILLFFENSTKKTKRMMQVIEWNMRKKDKDFRFSKCIYAAEIIAFVEVEPIFGDISSLMFGHSGQTKYECKIKWSNTY